MRPATAQRALFDSGRPPACGGACVLTCVGGVSGGSVEEAGGAGHAQVGHPRAVAVHGGRDGVVVGLLRGGAGHVPAGGHAVGVTGVTCRREEGAHDGVSPTRSAGAHGGRRITDVPKVLPGILFQYQNNPFGFPVPYFECKHISTLNLTITDVDIRSFSRPYLQPWIFFSVLELEIPY